MKIDEYIIKDLELKPDTSSSEVFPSDITKQLIFSALRHANDDQRETIAECLYNLIDPLDETEFKILDSILSVYPHFYHDDIPDMNVFDEGMIPF